MKSNGMIAMVLMCVLASAFTFGRQPLPVPPTAGSTFPPAPDLPIVLKVEVQFRGTLSYTDKEATVAVNEDVLNTNGEWDRQKKVWLLDFADNKKLRKMAQKLDKQVVLVTGSARLLGVQSFPFKRNVTLPVDPPRYATQTGISSSLNVERRVQVTALKEMKNVD